jgi:hypothetical protein
MNLLKLFLCLFLISEINFAQVPPTPLEKSGFTNLSNYNEMITYLKNLSEINPKINLEFIGKTSEDREIPMLKISAGKFGENPQKLKILIFAQQHGNEHSGKEGILLILKEIAEGKFDEMLKRLDLLIIPQMNPDGAEKDERRNSKKIDLNRNHLILTSMETQALHKIFNAFLPEMTLDVHEYSPYSRDWVEFGYIKNFDEQFGCATNLNVAENIINYSKGVFFPFIEKYLIEKGFSFNEYIVGGIGKGERIRHSTVDIDDGRQSLGILNSFSFILEGRNGRDSMDNMKHRALGQMNAIKGFLEFGYNNHNKIKELVKKSRKKLIESKEGESISIRMDHFKSGKPLNLKLLSVKSGKDTIVSFTEYNPIVKSLVAIKKPAGYLIPKTDEMLKSFLEKHNIKYFEYKSSEKDKIFKYYISGLDSTVTEETKMVLASIEERNPGAIIPSNYYFIPINQLSSNLIALALEPQSMLGLINYNEYKYLLKAKSDYSILKVNKK